MRPRVDLFGCLLALLLVGGAARVQAQGAGAVTPDRPGFGDGSATVAPGRLQLEAGVTYTDAGAVQVQSLGQLVLRVGVGARVELRGLLNSYVVQRSDAATPPDADGFEDVGLGAKVNLLAGSGTPLGVPALSALVSATVPTGSRAFTADEVVAELKLALDLGLTETAAFSANAGYRRGTEGSGSEQAFTYAALSASVPGTDGLGVFVGLFSLFPHDGDAGHGLDGGLTFLLNPATQLDVNGGLGLTDSQPDFFVGAGVARRF